MQELVSSYLAFFFNPGTLPGAVLYALLFLVLALLGTRLVRSLAARNAKYFPDRTVINFIAQLLQVVVFLLAIILYAQLVPALRAFGTALLAGVSIISIVVGLAAQSTLGNFISGLSLLIYRPFEVGDLVQLSTPQGVQTATVQSLTLGYTSLRTQDDQELIVPNSVMANTVLIKLHPQNRAD